MGTKNMRTDIQLTIPFEGTGLDGEVAISMVEESINQEEEEMLKGNKVLCMQPY